MTGQKVLIADDDPSIVQLLAACCAGYGMDVQTAANGVQAILRASRNPPRLVILDLHMPEADGFRVCEWLLEPRRPALDIIVLTSRADMETLERCESLGVYYIAKSSGSWPALRALLRHILATDDVLADAWCDPEVSDEERPLIDVARNKVLIVDEDLRLAEALARRLRKCGAVTFVAPDGVSGFRRAVKELPDVIVGDFAMSDGSGHYMLWRLNSTEVTRRIPVVSLGADTGHDRGAGAGYGTLGWGTPIRRFGKPVDIDALIQELCQHCRITYAAFAPADPAPDRDRMC